MPDSPISWEKKVRGIISAPWVRYAQRTKADDDELKLIRGLIDIAEIQMTDFISGLIQEVAETEREESYAAAINSEIDRENETLKGDWVKRFEEGIGTWTDISSLQKQAIFEAFHYEIVTARKKGFKEGLEHAGYYKDEGDAALKRIRALTLDEAIATVERFQPYSEYTRKEIRAALERLKNE